MLIVSLIVEKASFLAESSRFSLPNVSSTVLSMKTTPPRFQFAKQGARLVLWDLNSDANDGTRQLVLKEQPDADVRCYTVNVTDRDGVRRTADQVLEQLGHVDMVINNAGVVNGRAFLDTTDDMVQRTIDVNLMSLFYVSWFFGFV